MHRNDPARGSVGFGLLGPLWGDSIQESALHWKRKPHVGKVIMESGQWCVMPSTGRADSAEVVSSGIE